jgi:ABC-type glucose/galactose transport system permease subunit
MVYAIWQQIVKGLIIVVAVAFDIAKYYRKK